MELGEEERSISKSQVELQSFAVVLQICTFIYDGDYEPLLVFRAGLEEI